MVLIRSLGVLARLPPLNLGFGLGEIIGEFRAQPVRRDYYCCEANNAKRYRLFDNPAVLFLR